MKKFCLSLLFIIGLLCQPAFAKAVAVQALEDFTTENPPELMSIKILEDVIIDDSLSFKNGDIIKGKVVDVTDPKRLKRNATFSFVPVSYTDSNGDTIEIKGYYPAKYTTKLNKGELAKSAALGVGNFFVKGLSMGYSAVEGAVKNEKNNRFKSSVTEVYEDSVFSYVEKGGEIVIKKEQPFFLNFKVKDEPEEEDLPNYEYEELDNKAPVEFPEEIQQLPEKTVE